MTWLNDTQSKTRGSAKLAAGLAISAALLIGTLAGPAQARWGDRDDHRGSHDSWDGGYYRAPPVVYGGYYGSQYGYYAPPVVYGPGIGVNLPGISIGIR